MQKIEIIKQLAEEAIYSAKGHFKTSDLIEWFFYVFLIVPLLCSASTLFDLPPLPTKILTVISLIFLVIALSSAYYSSRPEADKEKAQHMDLGNKYLALYKELRSASSNPSNTISKFTKEIEKLDKESTECKISLFGRWYAKILIRKEVDLKWLDD